MVRVNHAPAGIGRQRRVGGGRVLTPVRFVSIRDQQMDGSGEETGLLQRLEGIPRRGFFEDHAHPKVDGESVQIYAFRPDGVHAHPDAGRVEAYLAYHARLGHHLDGWLVQLANFKDDQVFLLWYLPLLKPSAAQELFIARGGEFHIPILGQKTVFFGLPRQRGTAVAPPAECNLGPDIQCQDIQQRNSGAVRHTCVLAVR